MIVLTRLRDGETIDSDVTLTEQGVEEIIGHARVVRKVRMLSRSRDQFTPDDEFDIETKVRVVIGKYKKFQIDLIDGGVWFVRCLYLTELKRLYKPVRKDVKLATNGRYFRRGRKDGW